MSVAAARSSFIRPRRVFTLVAVVVGAAAVSLGIYTEMSVRAIKAKNAAANLAGKHAVVIGGTSGIGHGIAATLAAANASVTIVGRNAAAGQEIVTELSSKGTGKHRFLRCDGQLLANAKAFTDQYAVDNKSLDILVLTQGIATIQGRTETSEGLDQKLATHYYGRMAFLAGLLPLLRASAATGDFKPRVLTVLSAGAHSAYPHYDTDPELKEHYSLGNAAAAGCMYNDIAVDALSRDPANAGITFVHAAPGAVASNWGSEMPWYLKALIKPLLKTIGKSIYDAGEFMSEPLLRPAADLPATKEKGGFILMGETAQPVKQLKEHEVALPSIWAHTKEVLGRAGISI